MFDCSQTCKNWSELKNRVAKSKDRNVYDLFNSGLGCHHAGMLRSDRNLTERVFAEGAIKVLVCTATLAWGVNLPAHTVIIKGTKLYNAEAGKFVELSVRDECSRMLEIISLTFSLVSITFIIHFSGLSHRPTRNTQLQHRYLMYNKYSEELVDLSTTQAVRPS